VVISDVADLPGDIDLAPMYATEQAVARRAVIKETGSRAPVATAVLPRELKPVIITVGMAPKLPAPGSFVLQTGSNVVRLDTKTTSKHDKRSLIAKAVPVIKKPYDWLKAVASRLK
jgi:hypothetical protein